MSHTFASITLQRNYKVIYDPELDLSPIKQNAAPILEYESTAEGKAKDPRFSKKDYEKKSRLYTTLFQIVDFDKTPPTENVSFDNRTVFISNISPLSTESQIITVLSVYGTVLRIEILKDPSTGGPLGLAKVIFLDEASARRAIKNGNGRRVMISDAIQIGYDSTVDKLNSAFAQNDIISDYKIVADNMQIKKQQDQPLVFKRYSSSAYSMLPDPLSTNANIDYTDNEYEDAKIRKKPSRWDKSVGDPVQINNSNYQDYRSRPTYKDKRDTPPPLPSDEQKSYTKAVISGKCLPFMCGALEELKRIFYPFGYIDICHDAYDWFIVFESRSSAIQAQQSIYDNNQRVIGYPIELSIPALPTPSEPSAVNDPLLEHRNIECAMTTSINVSISAKQVLFDQLADIFLKDLKNRIAGPCIYDFLNPSLIKSSFSEPSSSTGTGTTAAITLQSDIVANARHNHDDPTNTTNMNTTATKKSIYKLPRFNRKSISQPSFEPFKPTPKQINDTDVHITSDQEQELRRVNKPIRANRNSMDVISTILRPLSPPPLSAPQTSLGSRLPQPNLQKQDINCSRSSSSSSSNSTSDDDFLGTVRTTGPTKKQEALKQLTHRKSFSPANRHRSTTITATTDSSSGSSIDNEEAYRRITSRKKKNRMLPKRRKSSASSTLLARKKTHTNTIIAKAPHPHEVPPTTVVDSYSNMEIDTDNDDQSGGMVTHTTSKGPNNAPVFDQALLDKVLTDVGQLDPEVEAWFNDEDSTPIMVTLNKEWDPFNQIKDVEDLEYLRVILVEKAAEATDLTHALEHIEKQTSQSARTRGYYPIPNSVKATYLNKNKALFEPPTPSNSSSLSRSGWRCRSMVVMQNNRITTESDILSFNQLKSHKKQLKFHKSPIHGWGLFADEPIQANEMVIEYVGEILHQQVAKKREREYERCGISSCYLFRVDDIVIDATKKGNMARFINHCCAPNCSAKVITVDKQKKIVICANRDIEPGEEITYDYKFPTEVEKLPCLCGSKFCKGTLN